jgi:hypothetical protein
MFPTASRAATFLVASLFVALASASPGGASERRTDLSASVAWRFHAGGTLPGPPAIGPDGTAYLGTSDGSFIAIGTDGVLRWSVTLEGTIGWSPVVDDSGRVYVATTAQKVHAFFPSGVRGWALRTPVRVATEPVLAPWGILFGGGDGSVWAVSSRGAPLWHVETGQSPSAAAGIFGQRMVVPTAAGDAMFYDGASRRFVAHLGNAVRSAPLVFRDGSAAVLSGSSLYRLDPSAAVLWRREGIDWFGWSGAALLVVDDRQELSWLSSDGTPAKTLGLGSAASGPPVPGDDGSVFVPCDSGALAIVRPRGSRHSVTVASSPLYRPVVDWKRRRLLLAAGDGTLAAVTLSN